MWLGGCQDQPVGGREGRGPECAGDAIQSFIPNPRPTSARPCLKVTAAWGGLEVEIWGPREAPHP